MRIADMDELLAGYKRVGIDPTPYYWFTDQRKYGTCEHGGYGLGVEACAQPISLLSTVTDAVALQRFLAWLANRHTVRHVFQFGLLNTSHD
jgi:asparaginyl-tRNA synthetase